MKCRTKKRCPKFWTPFFVSSGEFYNAVAFILFSVSEPTEDIEIINRLCVMWSMCLIMNCLVLSNKVLLVIVNI